MDEERLTEEERKQEADRKTEERMLRQALGRFWENPYYTPTKPVTQRFRIQIYSILIGIALAAGMYVDHETLFVGVVIIIKGVDLMLFRLRHGWYCRLTDKFLMLAGAAIAYTSYKDGHVAGFKHADEGTMFGFLAVLGIIYPLLMMLELWLMKLRCRKTEEAEVIDVLDSFLLLLPGAGFHVSPHHCPIFKVWRDGKETYICDEWFTKAKRKSIPGRLHSAVIKLYERNEAVTIRVHPQHDTEIYDKKRVRAYIVQKWKAWLIYNMLMIPAIIWLEYQIDEISYYYYFLFFIKMIHASRKNRKEQAEFNENGGNPYDTAGSEGKSTGTH